MRFQSRHLGNKRGGGGMMIRMILMGAILILLLLLILKKGGVEEPTSGTRYVQTPEKRQVVYWPAEHNQLVHYSTHTLSYNPDHKQSDWVAYILTREDLDGESDDALIEFKNDPDLEEVAQMDDYETTDYEMGQLLPFEDRSGNLQARQETFYMSNVSPQKKGFRRGIWRELEENIRNWARSSGRLYIVTGPVLSEKSEVIGDRQIGVPESFFKVILDMEGAEPKMIGFLIPNEGSDVPLESYAQTVDEIEELTQIDFFKSILLDQKLEDSLEADFDIDQWPIDEERYHKRVESWNQIKSEE